MTLSQDPLDSNMISLSLVQIVKIAPILNTKEMIKILRNQLRIYAPNATGLNDGQWATRSVG